MKLTKQLANISIKANGVGPDAAAAELPLKLRNERRLNRRLRSIFNSMGTFVKANMTDGLIPDLGSFTNELTDVLTQQARITSKSFHKNLTNRLKIKQNVNRRVRAEVDSFIMESTAKQANFIINTTNKNIEKIASGVITEASLQGIDITNRELTRMTVARFKRSNRNRVKTIAADEVQRISEKTKNKEAEILVREGIIKKPKKRWDATLDNKTRSWHAIADGQIVDFDEPFVVNGELLMHPGDRSLGASAKNLINCRCSAQFLTE